MRTKGLGHDVQFVATPAQEAQEVLQTEQRLEVGSRKYLAAQAEQAESLEQVVQPLGQFRHVPLLAYMDVGQESMHVEL